MESKEMLFVGIEISSGNRPITYAVLDRDLKVILLERYSISHDLTHLEQHTNVMLAVNVLVLNRSASAKCVYKVFADLGKKIIRAGFNPYLCNDAPRRWIVIYTSECFSTLSGRTPLARRTLPGRN